MLNMKAIIFSLVTAATLSTSVLANPLTFPNAKQRLPEPIEIPACHLKIIEWRPGLLSGTGPSPQGIKRLTEICTNAVNMFPKFLKAEGLAAPLNIPFRATISIMPYSVHEDGMDPGNLNDDFRFKTRPKFYNNMGQELSLFGYLDREEDYIYIRNDVFSMEFRKVFSHELYHMLSDQLGTYDSYHNPSYLKDEEYAKKFTKFLGLGE